MQVFRSVEPPLVTEAPPPSVIELTPPPKQPLQSSSPQPPALDLDATLRMEIRSEISRLLPEIAEKLIKEEIRKLLSDGP